MRFTQSWLAIGALVIAGLLPVNSLAKPSLEARVEHIESLLQNKITLETLNEIEVLKTEVQKLQGKLDEQQHSMEVLSQRQEKLFLDLEQRIGQLPKNPVLPVVAKEIISISNNTPQPALSTVTAPALPASSPSPLPVVLPTQVETQKKAELSSSTGNQTTVVDKALSEHDLYNAAYKLVDIKRYQEALVAFQDFLWQFPEGKYAPNAHYWLGEIYLSAWHDDRGNKLNLEKAVSSFKTVTTKYTKHNKAADALLKLGIIEMEQENWPAAKEYFNNLKQQYPGSSRAHMADIRLQQIKP